MKVNASRAALSAPTVRPGGRPKRTGLIASVKMYLVSGINITALVVMVSCASDTRRDDVLDYSPVRDGTVQVRRCQYDPGSWVWNMGTFEKFMCVMDDLSEQGAAGSASAMRDLAEWSMRTDASALQYVADAVFRAYTHRGHSAFVTLLQQLETRYQVALCSIVLDHLQADQATVDRFRAELNVTAAEMPFYPESE